MLIVAFRSQSARTILWSEIPEIEMQALTSESWLSLHVYILLFSLFLNNTQHGFRSGRSCLSTLLNVFDNLMNMIDSSTTVDMIYLDFSKVFDKVDHGIVLHKLRDLGITGNLGVWFHQFLSDRTQFVRLPIFHLAHNWFLLIPMYTIVQVLTLLTHHKMTLVLPCLKTVLLTST